MKHLRKIALVCAIIGGFLLFFGIALSAMSAYNSLFGISSLGIIGGVDFPTVWSIFQSSFLDKYLPLNLTGLVLIAVWIVLLIVGRKKK